MKSLVFFWVAALLLTGSCTNIPLAGVKPSKRPAHSIEFSRGALHVDLASGKSWGLEPVWPDTASDDQVREILLYLLENDRDFSQTEISTRHRIPSELRLFHLSSVEKRIGSARAVYVLDTLAIQNWFLKQYARGDLYFASELFTQDSLPVFELLLPVDSVWVPDNELFLPNSPREYRSGIHRGIDFQANWGTPFRSIADGVVVRADHAYAEPGPEQWQAWSAASADIGHTPDDLFYNVFMGRALIIDHGFNLFPGYRTISIYAHLAEINADIRPGTRVTRGQLLGLTGNSGTLPATRGTLEQAHLHLEVILQGKTGDIYLGQETHNEDLYPYLSRIFSP